MAEFVRAQIFGTTFEITSRFAVLEAGEAQPLAVCSELTLDLGIRNCNQWEWVHSDWSGMLHPVSHEDPSRGL
jgi:hypothetical protein